MAADTTDLPKLSQETLDSIRARMIARVNLGLDPGDPLFLDAVIGSIWGDLEGVTALELDEVYDMLDEVARAVMPATAYGEWLDAWADSLGLARKDETPAGGVLRFTGTPGTDIAAGFTVTTVAPSEDIDPIAFQVDAGGTIPGGGSIDLAATASNAGSAGNVGPMSVTVPAVNVDGLASVTNPDAMTGGADVESDEILNGRVRDALAGDVGSGTQSDYRRWALAWPGVGFVTVEAIWDGPGTVRVFITDTNNDPMPDAAVDGLKAALDPIDGQGAGIAPIGHTVTVATPDPFDAAVVATIDFDAGYSLDGAGGTRALEDSIIAAIRRYVDSLGVGEDIVRNKIIAAIVDVTGVTDVTALTINGSAAATIAVPAGEVAQANPDPDLS